MTKETQTPPTKKVCSPELKRLIRALEMVASDLPRIMRNEKEFAFRALPRVDLFEAHMKEMRSMPAHLEALTRVIDRSLQVEGSAAHLSRAFQAINNIRPFEPDPWENADKAGAVPPLQKGSASFNCSSEVVDFVPEPESGQDQLSCVVDDDHEGLLEQSRRSDGRNLDLNLEKVRNMIVPGGEIFGRSMFRSSRVRLITARASGTSPWRFQFRYGSLKWAAEAETNHMRGVAAMVCADQGYIEVPARLLLEKAKHHLKKSSGGNTVVRPSLAVYGRDAILHPGAMSASKPGEPLKLTFVEF